MQDRTVAFLHYLAAERGASRHTIDAYQRDLRQFCAFVIERTRTDQPDCTVIDRALITSYVAWLGQQQTRAGTRYTNATVARKVAAVRSFCAFLLDHGVLATNPTTAIEAPRAPKPVPRPMTTDDVDRLLRVPLQHQTPEALRDAAMLELMYATGMRVSELVALNLDSVSLNADAPAVRCTGKGAKERTIPVYAQACSAIERYLNDGRPTLARTRTQPALFVNRRGERLTRQGFWLILKQYARSAAIEGHVTPHTLRHSFATHMLRGGASVRAVQELLGHANVSTTQVYTQLADDHLRSEYDRVHPRAVQPAAALPTA